MVKKRSRTIIFIAIITAIIIVLAFIILTNLGSQGTVAGVKAGDEFIYDIKGYWTSNDPDLTVPTAVEQLNMTDWYKVAVANVEGAEVTFATTWHFINGTELQENRNVNVETGMKYPTEGFWQIYAANLGENDFVRPIGPDRSTINETATRNYASGARETNRISIVLEYYDSNNPSTTWTEYQNIHFDRQVGILVEFSDKSIYTNPDVTITQVWTLTETNRWTVS
jgi:hypothetical protein